MKTEDILFACVITPLIVIFFISIAYLIISILVVTKKDSYTINKSFN